MNTTSYLDASIASLSDRWITALKELNEITHRPSKLDYIAYMDELYAEAEHLHSQYGDVVHPIHLGKLLHILNRPISHATRNEHSSDQEIA